MDIKSKSALLALFGPLFLFMALMCGIAVDDGYIRSIDDPLTEYIPELFEQLSNCGKF